MLSLPNDGRYPALELTPQQRRQRTLRALVSQVVTFTHQNPVLMIFEDTQWTDPTTLELFSRVLGRMQGLRVLLLVTFRPEFKPPWIGLPHVTASTINRLAAREVNVMIDRIAGSKTPSASIRQDIIERTDGIPLFVEEMTKAVVEAGSERAAEHTAAAGLLPGLAVPASLHASLMARLDRLGSGKEVAQIGAAIGREFSHALLASVARKPDVELNSALDRLVAAGLLFREGAPPYASYLFKHALVQEAAYGTLLREPRRALHARIADSLKNQFADIAESQPEMFAHHCAAAGLVELAAREWGKAGQRSLTRSALVEAMVHLNRALTLIDLLPSTPALRRERITLQVALANALMHVKGYAAPETKASLEQARSLIEQAEAVGDRLDDPLFLFSVLFGFWIASYAAFDGDAVCQLAAQFLALAQKQRATAPLMIGHRIKGIALVETGEIAEGRAHLDQALALYDPNEHRALATRFGQDSRVSILVFMSHALWCLGYPEAARADAALAVKLAREINPAMLMYAQAFTVYPHLWRGDYATVNTLVDELIALAAEKGASVWTLAGMTSRGCLLALTGKASNGIEILTSVITAWRASGTTLGIPSYLSYLAKAYAEIGQYDDAWRCIAEAMAAVESAKERWCEADIHRIAGEIALTSPQPGDAMKAEAYFERALAVARAQGAKSWELRASMSLARLWRDQGKVQQARQLLAPVYGWFTEGFDTRDLKEAKALLAELS